MRTFLFVAMVALGATPVVAEEPGTAWTLKQIRVFNEMGSLGQVVAERYDANGGVVDVSVNGNTGGICPGGAEVLRFEWRFQNDVSHLDADGLAATVSASQLSRAGGCTDGLAGRSYLILRGSAGIGSPFTEAEAVQFDLDRLYTKSGDFVSPAALNIPRSGPASIGMSDRPYATDRPKAYFDVTIITPTEGQGRLRYAYTYERGHSTPIAPTPAAPGGTATTGTEPGVVDRFVDRVIEAEVAPVPPPPAMDAPGGTQVPAPPADAIGPIPDEMLGTLYAFDHVTEYTLVITADANGIHGRITSQSGAQDSRDLANIRLGKGDFGYFLEGDFLSNPAYDNPKFVCEKCDPPYSIVRRQGVMRGRFFAQFFSSSGKGYMFKFTESADSGVEPGRVSHLDFGRKIWWK